jgi:hypothetical protein
MKITQTSELVFIEVISDWPSGCAWKCPHISGSAFYPNCQRYGKKMLRQPLVQPFLGNPPHRLQECIEEFGIPGGLSQKHLVVEEKIREGNFYLSELFRYVVLTANGQVQLRSNAEGTASEIIDLTAEEERFIALLCQNSPYNVAGLTKIVRKYVEAGFNIGLKKAETFQNAGQE